MGNWRDQSVSEELANSVTHGIGALLSLVGGGALLYGAGGWATAGFASTLASVYVASTVYHAMAFSTWKVSLQTIDRVCIHFLLAGTLTPVVLHAPDPGHGTLVLWAMAGLGATFETFFGLRYQVLSSGVYGLWLAFGLALSSGGLASLDAAVLGSFVGGLACYAVGFGFFWWTELRYHHAIWHVCALIGSGLHFLTVWRLS